MDGRRKWRGWSRAVSSLTVLGMFAAVSVGFLGLADADSQTTVKTGKVPETTEEHFVKAKEYLQKAAAYLEEVETHRQMLEAYRHKVVVNPKSQYENPWLKKMRKHCEAYIRDAQRMAADAKKFAEYHELRGRELQGE